MRASFNVMLAIFLSFALALVGCSSGKQGTATVLPTAKGQSSPSAVKPVTFNALIVDGYNIDFNNNSPYYKELEKQTKVHLQFEIIPKANQDKINLMFASRKYPDLLLTTNATDKQMLDASVAGDLMPLDDLIKQYSPNWTKLLKEHPEVKKAITFPDGKIYSLPTIMELPEQVGIRDQWLINKKWLDQLGLKVPTTTDEFEAALMAFKKHAGEGVIPKNAIPWYFRYNQYSQGQFDINGGSFGILTPDENYITVKDGKVQFVAMNPEIKKPLAYMNKLYSEGLIPPEVFTDDQKAYVSKRLANPSIVGSMHAFANDNHDFVAMMPPKAPGVTKQLFRQQTAIVVKNRFTLPKNNPDPAAAMRLADVMAEPDWTVQDWYGMIGQFVKKEGNTYTILQSTVQEQNFPNIEGVAAITPDVAARIKFDPASSYYDRQQAVEMYKPIVAPLEDFYPDLMFTPEESDKLAQLRTDINGYTKETFAKWITKGGMDAEWDSYINKLNSMKVADMIKILQTALDRYNKG